MTKDTRLKVLVVDDEENIRHMLTLVLKKAGYAVRTVDNAQAGLDALMSEPWDMVLSDIRMPGMTGHDLLDTLRERGMEATVIMMSAYGDRDTALEAIKRGAYDYISKPFKKDEVLLTLRKAEERERLRRENVRLREETRRSFSFDNIIARSAPMQAVFRTVRKIAGYKSTVLITGESGTGKELIARALHVNSDRVNRPWVPVNCGAIPETLLESELFGHVKGAFTDAVRDKKGLFQQADGGTLFLDEVAELPLNLQVKLLRVLQEGEIRPVGNTRSLKVNVRVVAATHQDLEDMVQNGRFRQDLYYRLNVLPLALPPLRDRPEDIPLLAQHFVQGQNQKLGTNIQGFSPDTMKLLLDYPWPGNVRELENTVERALVLSDGPLIQADSLPSRVNQSQDNLKHLLRGDNLSIKQTSRELERILITRALEKTRGNRTRASELLEISHRALLYKIKDYGLQDMEW